METLHIIKIGGNIIDKRQELAAFMDEFSKLQGFKILVHGGGKSATQLAGQLGIQQTILEGRRVTDAETLKVTVMVYAGLVNKTIVAALQSRKCHAIGLCGADANIIQGKKRINSKTNFGFVGDIVPDGIDTKVIQQMIKNELVPVFSSIIHDGEGQLLNTNADTIASSLAVAMSKQFSVHLTYCFEKKGVLSDVDNEESYLKEINLESYGILKSMDVISKGMIPKLDNAFHALEQGVKFVRIGHAEDVFSCRYGTQLI